MAFAPNGSLWVGQSNRGWNSVGPRSYGLQRLDPTGRIPFEILSMSARPDGFELRFTRPVDPEIAESVSTYRLSSYTYELRSTYGSPELDERQLVVDSATVFENGRGVRLKVQGLRAGYVHELACRDLISAEGSLLLHSDAYYTLNRIPRAEN